MYYKTEEPNTLTFNIQTTGVKKEPLIAIYPAPP